MCALSACQRLGEVFGQSKITPIPVRESENKVALVVQKVLDAKEAHVAAALENKWHWSNVVLIGGDVFTTLYLVFQAALSFKASLSAIPAIAVTGLVCGILAGVINTGVGILCGVEGFQAFLNGDYKLASRLALDCLCYTSIGIIMVLAALALKVGALAAVGAFFTAHPWVLPVLFFAASIPLLIELGSRINNVATSKDLGSQLKLNALESQLKGNNIDWDKINRMYPKRNPFNMQQIEGSSQKEQILRLSDKMEQLQANIGVEAAVEAFKLLKLLREKNREEALAQIEIVKEKIEEWNRSLYLRMFQQVLYLIGFGLSMGALSSNAPQLLNGIQSSFLALANGIPFYMDTWWPFKRNTPMVVPKVQLSEIKA